MQKKNEECKKNVKAKEIITTLCKLLSALDVESVPTAEVFRRAKFNKTDVAKDLWRFLSALLQKSFKPDCACAELTNGSTDTMFHFVKCALWQSGYGGWWVVQSQGCESRAEIGSRDLLLAFSWVIASGNLLEALLRERLLQLDALSYAAVAPPQDLELNRNGCEADIRSLQWQYGKLKLRWRSLFTAQQEQAKLTDQVCRCMSSSPTCYPGAACLPNRTGPTAVEKDLECIQPLNRTLAAYLEWKNVEPMFWCWMDSVIDCHLSDGAAKVGLQLRDQVVNQGCYYGDKARRAVRNLDKMLLKLQDRPEVPTDTTRLSHRQKVEVERRVAARLQDFDLVDTPTATDRGFVPHRCEPPAPGKTCNRQTDESAGILQVSSVLKELRNRKAVLDWKMELLRQNCREELQSKANAQDGLLLILPLKR